MINPYKKIYAYLLKFSILALLTSCLLSCEDEPDLGPLPSVEFNVPNFGEINTKIQFNNSSSAVDGGALTYLWDFGDGDQSVNSAPDHEYDNSGEYVVSLTATTEKGASETVFDTLIVGERFLTRVDIYYTDTIAFINSENDTIIRPWDKNNGPDLLFDLENANGDVFNVNGQIVSNATESPVSITANGDFKLLNESFTVTLLDIDQDELLEFSANEDFDDFEDFDIIAFGSFNPASQDITFNPNEEDLLNGYFEEGIDEDTGEGLVALGDGFSFFIEIYFEIKL